MTKMQIYVCKKCASNQFYFNKVNGEDIFVCIGCSTMQKKDELETMDLPEFQGW